MKKLFLLRHAEAESLKNTGDHDRPLHSRGKLECKKLRAYMHKNKLLPQMVLCSDSLRTVSTTKIVFNDLMDAVIMPSKKLYNASAGEILKEVAKVPDVLDAVAIVGHNPGIQELAIVIANQDSGLLLDIKSEYPTCALAEFSFNVKKWHEVGPGIGKLEKFIKSQ